MIEMAESTHKIKVCLKCKTYIHILETFSNKTREQEFDRDHIGHSIILTNLSDINMLECGKVTCEDDEKKENYHYSL